MSKLLEQIKKLSGDLEAYKQFCERSPEKVGRYATMAFTYMFLRHTPPGFSLGAILEHPDMPKDTEPLYQLPDIDGTVRVMFASQEWDLVPEGMIGPTINLYWERNENGDFTPKATGAKPRYHREVKCPHCQHLWEDGRI